MASKVARRRDEYATIVVGSGSAGLFAALQIAQTGPVLLVTKGALKASNTWYAQGGMAAALGVADSVETHLQDTIAAGAGIVDEAAARVLCAEAPAAIRALEDLGVAFDRSNGDVALGREAAHSQHRIVHAGGDRTGQGLITGLKTALERSDVDVLEGAFVSRLLRDGDYVCGIEIIDAAGSVERFWGGAIVLATGGAGQLYSHTTNPEVATGDGLALAFATGAELADLEFFQFHPTAFRRPRARPFLVSEAIRGEGAILRNARGEAFMEGYHPMRELAPRDVVARAMVSEMRKDEVDHVFLDCTAIRHVDVRERFPGVTQLCGDAGVDIRHEPIPVAPAAHYFMGGVRTDDRGRTTVPGLYACGEVACTGVHGANRLASNSLAETVVFASRVAEDIAHGGGPSAAGSERMIATAPRPCRPPDWRILPRMMWEACGIERNAGGLYAAINEIAGWPEATPTDNVQALEGQGMTIVAQLMLEAALRREESRGAHYRSDFPERDDVHWEQRQVFRRGD